MATRDARSLSAEALEALRRRAIAAIAAGATRAEVARLFGVSRKTVSAWVAAYEESGEDALRPKRRGRRPGEQLALSPKQQACAIQAIVEGTPDRHGLPHALWTRLAIADLVERSFGIRISPATVSQYLLRWGLIEEHRLVELMRGRVTSVAPARGGTGAEWLPHAETLWLAWTRPHAPADPRRGPVAGKQNLLTGFRDYFGDVNVLLAVTNRSVVYFQAQRGPFDHKQTTGFVERLMAQLDRDLNIIVYAWPPQHHGIPATWATRHPARVSVRFPRA
ncbi:helix-turn-helix domain-containing protein [Amycolatopsis sp. K13G38]|uniref:Helix-turn-helix domain-containing protein n=1 Tax=Amycolatopsis acididurans TaxID=2724524 RepID=A0ABX1JE08_9PSEU|nr:helix-turn-helix domain-containing protein [Amycolatopsis acididurans]NKQ57893.1 helix-turn-helix domain-containing protein [Amycolatopsis acididurans]